MQNTALKRWAVRSVGSVAAAGAFLGVLAVPAFADIIGVTGFANGPSTAITAAISECRRAGGTFTGKILEVDDLGGGVWRATAECDM